MMKSQDDQRQWRDFIGEKFEIQAVMVYGILSHCKSVTSVTLVPLDATDLPGLYGMRSGFGHFDASASALYSPGKHAHFSGSY